MKALVTILMLLVGFNFILKQTFRKWRSIGMISVACCLFVGLMWPLAIEQSKTQIADWLANQKLMLDIAVVLNIEVALQMAFCLLSVYLMTTGQVNKRTLWTYYFLRWFPGILIFPVLFYTLVTVIFSFPGQSFLFVAWILGICILFLIPACKKLLQCILPEKELRLELLFLTNALIAVLGVVATVNGRTDVDGNTQVDWSALAGISILTIFGGTAGLLAAQLRQRYKSYKSNQQTIQRFNKQTTQHQ